MTHIANSPCSRVLALLLLTTSCASAEVTASTSASSLIVDATNAALFNDLTDGQSLLGYEEDGVRVSVNRTYYDWDVPGLDSSGMFYPNTGSLELVDISRSSGADFQDLDMQIASGWSPESIGTVFVWVQLYNDGSLVQEFDIDMLAGSYLGFAGGGFDQILIGSYVNAERRDLHNPFERNAIAIDNLRLGTLVPAPASSVMLGLGLLMSTRRRRSF